MNWYGTTAAWWAPLERDAKRQFGPTLRHHYGRNVLSYVVDELDIIGDPQPVTATIRFYAEPPYSTFGLPAQDFPKVFAKPGATSPHRYRHDDSLCLWQPQDPAHARWTSDKGLLDLIEITRRHLVLENYWRETGGEQGGIWVLPDAPHGLDPR